MLSNIWKRQAPQMVGIDIGSHEVKAILLSKTADGYKILSHAAIPLKKGAVNDHEIRDREAVVEALKLVKRVLPKTTKFAAVAVSGSAVMTKVIYMDASLSEEEMEAQIEIEADNLIPYSLDEVNIDFETLSANKTDPTKVDVLLSACRSENIDTRTDALDEVNLEVKVVDVEGYALGRSFEMIAAQLPEDAKSKVIALVDIGASITTFSVVENGETTFVREQAFGGEQFTQSILSFYGMTYEQAEKAKLAGELPRNYMFEVLSPFQTQLLQQIKRTLQIYCTSSGKDKVDHIVLCGGTAKLEGMTNLMINELGVNTIVGDPFKGCLHADDAVRQQLQPDIGKYMLACGLALRSYAEWRT
ncbi:pilus assembly protein PilM [Shewanella sp. Choline-02u-19]|uniref:pilus assembly protein PilM n=1 Tax=unclassified Shewanella TaxID=196818 RepID=UPI000C32E743|nr:MULTISPECIES: pilus assembly protein PilM [unclassified Shewanella]PKG57592.1 pilus assembly protein PilM [Shewanella sp. GutDb-MelDb]PKG75601.1 pilus assembly protein PilM [Shewanella sp. GutCb]PKH54001.1 pilus assembly protein PilM [Shewanella sp. Bg11-22]PKI30514.1 pilus assembly protein PilM [Shewanella sp. Choline-02u-19]